MAMESCYGSLSKHLLKLNLNSPSKSIYLDVLMDIKSNYECIFSWDIYEKTEKCRNKLTDVLEKVINKKELIPENNNTFNFNRLCLCLISSFEIFLNGEFSKSLTEIDNLIQILESTKVDPFFKSISNACFHIVQATRAYIMAFLEKDIQEVLKSIKSTSSFNNAERAAVCAIKSKVFMEYPPKGITITLELAECAQNLNDSEMYWKSIWLKARGRKRRFDNRYALPFRDEFDAAQKLCKYNNNPELLLSAANIFREAGFILKISGTQNYNESIKNYKIAADLSLKIYEQNENNLCFLYHCLSIFMDIPKNVLLNHMNTVDKIVFELSQEHNKLRICEILGKYFLKIKKDYGKAKSYLVIASSVGSFAGSLQLLKVECLLKSVVDFPVVQYLESLYQKYNCPKRKLIIISQILLYYVYVEKNPKQLLHYLNVYLNEDIGYTHKKNHINATFPIFILKTKFKPNSFFNILVEEIEKLKKYSYWNSDDKKTMENVIFKFAATSNPERNEENTEINLTCVICLEVDSATVVLRPCNHQCVCKTCWNVLKEKQPLCPMCRSVVISTLII